MRPPSQPPELPWFLERKENVAVFGTLTVGVLLAAALVWLTWSSATFTVLLIHILLGLAGGDLWGLGMWVVLAEPRRRRLLASLEGERREG